ncbi:MAG: DNA translocase FtsK 4TM domain-containing protein [Thermoanaerobaculaceae bacterium]|nr:DNA translocase FtsK 4TM domain-containing protein [Thermoanaerobaculaceae bacterium]MDI9621998.1 DNA translocase FtsK 4TM domain-containing protein [Acidobacteriota bacterium]NLH10883.1 DNA translocase FtsK [Holophagae bacterium]HPW54787.1 DNA translocase FtsK 4TM domain-containing protein [Thermoanaerobaculaceae bacterium]
MTRTREEIAREFAGYVLLVGGGLLLLALVSYHPLDPWLLGAGSDRVHNWLASWGAHIAGVLVYLLGVPVLVLPALVLRVGALWLRVRSLDTPWLQVGAWSTALLGASGLLGQVVGRTPYRGGTLEWGGEIGRLVADGLQTSLGPIATVVLCAAALLAGVVLGVRSSLMTVFSGAGRGVRSWRERMRTRWHHRRDQKERAAQRQRLIDNHVRRHPVARPALVVEEREGEASFSFRRLHHVVVVNEAAQPSAATPSPSPPPSASRRTSSEPATTRASSTRVKPLAVQEVFPFVDETPVASLPEKTMLAPAPPAPELDRTLLTAMRELVEQKCREFRVEGQVVDVLPGPIITTYEFRPAAGVKYAQVVNLEEDLALGLQVEAVRIERIPGKATVGFEVPNPERQTIVLREILESSKFVHSASPLTLALGMDIHGRPFVADLQRMPHLLIGGFTGSGKSVGLNAMIMSILFKATPEQVRFILIDPKQVELGIYEHLPHLLTPIVTDPRDAARALRWAVREMRERYQLLAACKVRNLQGYNTLVAEGAARRSEPAEGVSIELKPLPYIVIIIDELADLMMTCAAEVEDSIGHLAQMARAVGIHLIFATQRPSVDIITGVIKANFPCRIAFKVRTRFDSRTILDTEGAEYLLGMGDMLFLPPGSARPFRVHGCLVREEEILTVLKHLRRLGKPEFDPRVLQEPMGEGGEVADNDLDDPMYEQAARLVVASRKASASFIQRKLRLGYARSARLVDIMEREGLVGPGQGAKPREVLVPPDYFGEVDASHELNGEEDSDG